MGENFGDVMFMLGGFMGLIIGLIMFMNLMILGIGFVVGKIVLLMMVVYVIVYFWFWFVMFVFWVIFMIFFFLFEVCIVLLYEVVYGFGMMNNYIGLIVLLLVLVIGIFFFW